MLVNIGLRSTYKANNIFKCNFYFDPIILLDARKGRGEGGRGGGVLVSRLLVRVLGARDGVPRKNRFKNQINRNANNE